ncbi:transcription elongation factor GreA [Candidatus Collierbacteria bacterium]|nr:transcription elongation factor GreA [Candidatus Collierbacteria bacterium]
MKQNNKVHLTLTGYKDLAAELEDLKSNKLSAAIERVSRAREFGDLSENAEYHQSRDDHATLVGRIDELTDIINRSEIIEITTSKTQVGVGSKVKVSINGTTHEFTIVGEWEADPAEKKISHESPLGKALMGKGIGEEVEVVAPVGKVIYHIKEIA